MLNIKTRIKIKQIQAKFKDKLNKILCCMFKPLLILEDKIYKYKQNKINKQVEEIDEDLFIHLLVKNHMLKRLVKYPNQTIEFCYEKDYKDYYDDKTILTYTRDLKDNVLKKWSYKFNFNEEAEVNKKLLEKLKKELEKYPEIECYDYQRNRYYSKVLIIELNENSSLN